MIRVSTDDARLRTALDAMVRRTMAMDLTWDWPCGVAYYGVAQAYEATGEDAYLELLQARVDELIDVGLPGWTVNTCAMGHSLLTLQKVTGEQRYGDILEQKMDYLRHRALRFGDGVLQHTVSANNDFPEQAWADTLFMAAFLMLRVGARDEDRALVDDALNQYFWHIEYLQDPATGLFYHGYDNVRGDHMSGFFWARANAWAAYTMSQVGRTIPQPYLYPQFMDVDSSLRDQLAGVRALQTPDGLWRTVLDDEESYEELSASAGIAAAMLAGGNPLHTRAVAAAQEGVLANVSPDGRLLNTSAGTAVMRDREGYRSISRKWTQGWGQGLGLTFLAGLLTAGEATRAAEAETARTAETVSESDASTTASTGASGAGGSADTAE
ncbi:glycoside hydrolase 105 family protein [Miniimonas arenae]|uniref:Glycoside hydrolase 105 family protein n=1 Tax=Miniimonas arenae TaxID=676201 RepID=A0A5C5BDB1_9MICO|nr:MULTISPECIES: glycoside hydrolase family 88 protein [Miniimonas]TNU76415.1 glycoside hydrolase 105 family protein [Miniimonas arenae]